jgi:hypothetical protein
MEQRDSRCPYLLSSETTAKGTGLAKSAGKEDPVELDSSLRLSRDTEDVAYVGGVSAFALRAVREIPLLWSSLHSPGSCEGLRNGCGDIRGSHRTRRGRLARTRRSRRPRTRPLFSRPRPLSFRVRAREGEEHEGAGETLRWGV